MSQPPGTADGHMDLEHVLAAAKTILTASTKLLELESVPHEVAQDELEEIATLLSGALGDVLGWMPARGGEANQLLGAIDRFLP